MQNAGVQTAQHTARICARCVPAQPRKLAQNLTGGETETVEVIRKPGESAAVAFDRVSVLIRKLHGQGYCSKVPFAALRPGQFTLEARDGGTGWTLTVCLKPGESLPEFSEV